MNFKDFAVNIVGAVLIMAAGAALIGFVAGLLYSVAAMAFRFWN
jgi:hypothetical protein